MYTIRANKFLCTDDRRNAIKVSDNYCPKTYVLHNAYRREDRYIVPHFSEVVSKLQEHWCD